MKMQFNYAHGKICIHSELNTATLEESVLFQLRGNRYILPTCLHIPQGRQLLELLSAFLNEMGSTLKGKH